MVLVNVLVPPPQALLHCPALPVATLHALHWQCTEIFCRETLQILQRVIDIICTNILTCTWLSVALFCFGTRPRALASSMLSLSNNSPGILPGTPTTGPATPSPSVHSPCTPLTMYRHPLLAYKVHLCPAWYIFHASTLVAHCNTILVHSFILADPSIWDSVNARARQSGRLRLELFSNYQGLWQVTGMLFRPVYQENAS